MNKTKLIIHERFNGKQTLEDVFLSAFQSESYQLLQDNSSVIMNSTEQSQDLSSSVKNTNVERMKNNHRMYNAALYCRLRKPPMNLNYFP